MLLNESDYKLEIPVSKSLPFANLSPDVKRAQLKFIQPIIGVDLESNLEPKYQDHTLTAAEQLLVDKIQPALSHLATWMYLPKGNVYVSEAGIQASHTETTKPAFEWQVKNFRQSLLNNGFDALDELIAHLEAVANVDFPDWLTSEGCTLVREFFINSSDRFTYFVNKLNKSRYHFSLLVPIMRRVELRLMPGVISKGVYDEIKTEIKADNLSAANLAILDNIQGAVAHLTWAEALEEMGVIIDDEGIHLLNNASSGTVDAKIPADNPKVMGMVEKHRDISREYADLLRNQLFADPDTYPLWKASELYPEDEEYKENTFENTEDSGIYGMI